MKHKLFFCLCLSVSALLAAPKGYVDPQRVKFTAKSGQWKDGKNWDLKKTPAGFARAYVPAGANVTLACPVDITESILLGNASTAAAVLHIEDGARVNAGSLGLHGTFTNATGVVYMRGGSLSVGKDSERLGMLGIGTGSTCSGKMTMEVSGGKISGGIAIGSPAAGTQAGVFRVVGSAPEIATNTANRRSHFALYPSGTLEFVCDDKGVATLDFRGAAVLFEGGKIVVDGKNYRGGDKRIVLFEAKRISDRLPSIDIVNFPREYETRVFPEISSKGKSESLILKITRTKD